MEKIISATDAVRRFSEILNSIKYGGDSYTITRGGKPVAVLRPAHAIPKQKTLREIRGSQPSMPKGNRWT